MRNHDTQADTKRNGDCATEAHPTYCQDTTERAGAKPMARVKKTPAKAAADILDMFPVSSIKLADRMGCTSQAIRKWRAIGIPCKWHGALLGVAEEIGLPLTRERLEEASSDLIRLPPRTKANAIRLGDQ